MILNTEKRSLESDHVNSSGFSYFDPSKKTKKNSGHQILEPFKGEFHAIDPLPTWDSSSQPQSDLNTWGANDQTIRTLFQDYTGVYVFHCHILPHEDSGMMQVIAVVENTDSSWLIPAETDSFLQNDGTVELRLAQNFKPYKLTPEQSSTTIERAQVGDLTHNFTQDIILLAPVMRPSGSVELYDGEAILQGHSNY